MGSEQRFDSDAERAEVPLPNLSDALTGVLLGTAVGDALGLPCEGLSKARQRKFFPDLSRYHLLLGGYGLCSDDTEHACMTAAALAQAQDDPQRFARILGWKLRFWLLALPAGIGLATLKSILRLWSGVPPARSGVISAGNGPAMRSPLIGVYYAQQPEQMKAMVQLSTWLTHRDPRAEYGAMAIAVLAGSYVSEGPLAESIRGDKFLQAFQEMYSELHGLSEQESRALQEREMASLLNSTALPDFVEVLRRTVAAAQSDRSDAAESLLQALGCSRGISGFVMHTVPAVIFFALRKGDDFEEALKQIIRCGGDSDSTAAILGGVLGARYGADLGASPQLQSWLEHLIEWPRSVRWMKRLASALAESQNGRQSKLPTLNIPGVLLRNLIFVWVVLGHGFRRLLPPY